MRKYHKSKLFETTTGSSMSSKPKDISTTSSMIHTSSNQQRIQFLQESTIKNSIKKSIYYLQLEGYLSLIISILVNIPWILLLFFVKESIEYNNKTDPPSY